MMRLSGALAALALMSCASAPGPEQQGAHLMAQLKAASGGARLDTLTTYHMTGTRQRDGTINGVFDEWGDFRTTANTTVETFDGVTTSGGYDGKVGWSAGPDGKARIESRPDRLAGIRLGAYINTQGYYFPDRFPATFTYHGRAEADGKSFDVVTVTPAGAMSANLWLDPETHLLTRLTGAFNEQSTFTGVVESHRFFDGVWMMTTGIQMIEAGTETHTESQVIATYDLGSVPPERLAPPQ